MALKHAILAALQEGPASGYELSKRFDVSVANFWPSTPQQIYRELDRLEADGQLAADLVEQERRPNKRVFSVTEPGREELNRFIESESRPTAIRDDLLVKVVALDRDNGREVAEAVRERLGESEAKLDLYRQLRADALRGRDEAELLRAGKRIGSYLTLLRGISFEEETQAWCRSTLKVLAARESGVSGEVPADVPGG